MAATRDRSGRPTQLHGVPLEERAIDANGNRLPWAYDYPDDHPQARYQKRQPEEKGAFGKTSRRLGSSRATRTQTPAKKENTTIDGFAAALKYDQQIRETEGRSLIKSSQAPADGPQSLALATKEPQQILIYGFAAEVQWAAISFYERVSGGLICEDYPRDPPAEKRKYNNGISGSASSMRRTLTQQERVLAAQYHGGNSWIVVTFDSREAADRALAASPHSVSGYWAFAEPWRGVGPADDTPIPGTEDAARAKSATMGARAVQRKQEKTRQPATLPKDNVRSRWADHQAQDEASETSTVTSATATATGDDMDGQARHRIGFGSDSPQGDDTMALTPKPKTHFTHFPNTPRTVIKPATEALLPQSSWWEGLLKSLAASGWIPGDMIGSSVPRKEDGSFDLDVASIYWRFWYWIDCIIGTDLCGLKED